MPEGEKEQQEIENLFEKIMKENFPNLAKEIDIQVQEVQRSPNKMNQKSFTSRHIVIKRQKVKDGDSESKKQLVTYKGAPVRLSADFSKETLQDRRHWQELYKVMKSKDLHPRLLCKAITQN